MSATELAAQIEAARAYEGLFVPALFGQWAEQVAEAGAIQAGQKVLDIACGTGVLAREAAARVGAKGYVAGLDANPGMLAVAAEYAPEVDWREGIAENLPFPDDSFDGVVSQFGLMFFTDRAKALREMSRVLKPGGHLAIAVWDGLANNAAYANSVELLDRLAGQQAAAALSAPYALGDKETLEELFSTAADSGLANVAISTHRGRARFPSISIMVEADLRGWLPVMGVNLPDALIDQILDEAETELGACVQADGSMAFEVSAHIITASRAA